MRLKLSRLNIIVDGVVFIAIEGNSYEGVKTLTFKNVKTLKMDSTFNFTDETSVAIDDIRSNQWENLNFRVSMWEDEILFYCQSYEVK